MTMNFELNMYFERRSSSCKLRNESLNTLRTILGQLLNNALPSSEQDSSLDGANASVSVSASGSSSLAKSSLDGCNNAYNNLGPKRGAQPVVMGIPLPGEFCATRRSAGLPFFILVLHLFIFSITFRVERLSYNFHLLM